MNLRLEQYNGVWGLYRPAAEQLLAQVRSMNLTLHLEQQAKARKTRQRPLLGGKTPRADYNRGPDPKPAAWRKGYLISDDGVAVIELIGTVTKYSSSMMDGPATVDVRRALRAAVGDPAVQRIVLLVDSPGGSVAGVDDLASDIAWASTQKPVCAYIEDLGASAAYYLASQAGRVSANPAALIGSIGVYTVVYDLSTAYETVGVKTHVVSTGGLKGAGVDGQPIGEELLAELQKVVDHTNTQFVAALMRGRRMTAEQVSAINDGRIYTAAQASRYGLIDAIETWDDMLAAAWPLAAGPASGPTDAAPQMAAAHEEVAMSDQKTNAPPTVTPQAATLAELKTIAGSTAEFREAAAEAGLTLAQAQAMFDREAASRPNPKDVVRAGASAAPLPTRAAAETTADDDEPAGDAVAEFEAKVAAKMQTNGGDRLAAVKAVGLKHRDLHARYVSQTQAAHGGRVIRPKRDA